jgi:hypothetical protein
MAAQDNLRYKQEMEAYQANKLPSLSPTATLLRVGAPESHQSGLVPPPPPHSRRRRRGAAAEAAGLGGQVASRGLPGGVSLPETTSPAAPSRADQVGEAQLRLRRVEVERFESSGAVAQGFLWMTLPDEPDTCHSSRSGNCRVPEPRQPDSQCEDPSAEDSDSAMGL